MVLEEIVGHRVYRSSGAVDEIWRVEIFVIVLLVDFENSRKLAKSGYPNLIISSLNVENETVPIACLFRILPNARII